MLIGNHFKMQQFSTFEDLKNQTHRIIIEQPNNCRFIRIVLFIEKKKKSFCIDKNAQRSVFNYTVVIGNNVALIVAKIWHIKQ